MAMRICAALGSARKSPNFSPIRSSQVAAAAGASSFGSVERSSAIARFIWISSLRYFSCTSRPDSMPSSSRILRWEERPLAEGGFGSFAVHKARGFAGAVTGRTECRFDQRPVQRRFGLRGNGRSAGTGPLRPWFRARAALGSAGRRDQRLEGFRHFGGRAEAIVRADREQTVDDRDQAVGEARPDVRDRDMTLPDPLDEPILPGHAGEGIGPREQAVHRAAETEEVRPGIDRLYA